MRQINTHKVNPVNDKLEITAIEAPSGEPTTYKIGIPHAADIVIRFQLGPINECGVNGVTQEALLAIIRDRLDYFQRGAFVCRENAQAIDKIDEALHWLHARTFRRMQAGTEGTRKPDLITRVPDLGAELGLEPLRPDLIKGATS